MSTTPDQHSLALADVIRERMRQEDLKLQGRFKYTCADHQLAPGEKLAILTEEVGEVARAILEGGNIVSDKHSADLRKELVQVAAVALAWVESLS